MSRHFSLYSSTPCSDFEQYRIQFYISCISAFYFPYKLCECILDVENFLVFRLEDALHVALARAGAIRAQSNMASALLKGKQIIPWRITMLQSLFTSKDMSLDFLLYMMGIWGIVYLPIYKSICFLTS